MPRFTIQGVLIVVTVVALWLSTIVDYPGGHDVRYAIVLLTVVAAASQAYCSSGWRKYFWLPFFLVLLVAAHTQGILAPAMQWVSYSLQPLVTPDDVPDAVQTPPPSLHLVEFVADTIKLMADLVLAGLAGTLGLYIRGQTSRPDGA